MFIIHRVRTGIMGSRNSEDNLNKLLLRIRIKLRIIAMRIYFNKPKNNSLLLVIEILKFHCEAHKMSN